MDFSRPILREWRRIVSVVPPGRRRWAAMALVGWWLSPLTAWNDAFTNIPLAIGIAYLLRAAGAGIDPRVAAVGAYIFTNVLGLALLWIGVGKLSLPRRRSPWTGGVLQLVIRIIVYAALVFVTVWWLQELLSGSAIPG
jgi:hypothetical protein